MRLMYKKLICFIFVAFVIFSILSVGVGVNAYADTFNGYTNVIEDLHKDKTFNVEAYPAVDDDNGIYVIQIAESNASTLIVYVYQPAAAVRVLPATSINISTGINDNKKYENYKLTLLNSVGVFSKYRVEGFELLPDLVRYYDIPSIFREYVEGLDEPLPEQNPNILNEISLEVGQVWTVCTINGDVSYSKKDTTVIEINNKYVGYVRYKSQALPDWLIYIYSPVVQAWEYIDCHYIAFSTEFPIDKLLEADVFYISQKKYTGLLDGTVESIVGSSDPVNLIAHLGYDDVKTVTNPTGWATEFNYMWKRIQTVEEFKESENLKSDVAANLEDKQWILRFTETETKTAILGLTGYTTKITDVTILRLKFETDGETYNLGVVDDKQSLAPYQPPDNVQPKPKTFWQSVVEFFNNLFSFSVPWWVWLIVAVIILAIALPILSIFFPIVGSACKAVFRGIWWVISAPFRFIGWIIKKIKGGD